MDDVTRYALGRVWTLVSGAVDTVRALPGAAREWMPRSALALAFRELRLAEAAARRALIVMASTAPISGAAYAPLPSTMPPEKDTAPPPSMPPTGRAGKVRADRAPCQLFCLSDTIRVGAFEPVSWSLLGLGDAGRVAPDPSAPVRTRGLKARLAALEALLADPGPTVQRLIKRRARPRRHMFDRGGGPRLRPGRPPGFIPRLRMEWSMDVLMEIHQLAWDGPGRPPPRPPPAP
ncbi:MAG: hypothetical protein AAGH87_01780 [Pseudomonadota bacterium]